MIRGLWYYIKVAAFGLHLKPVGLFLLVHTILWCDAAWAVCQIMCGILGIPAALHGTEILLIMAYSGTFIGVIGGAIYLMHEDLV